MTLNDAQVDLTNCDREPIHIPGRIQPHGLLLVLSEPDLTIVQISANAAQHTGGAALTLLGQPLAALVPATHIDYLHTALTLEQIDQNPLYLWTTPLIGSEQHFDGVIHRHNGVLILELELSQARDVAAPDFYRMVKGAVAKVQRAPSFDMFCDAAVQAVQSITGFDRVMLYRFDDDGHGSVVAEAATEGLTPYLGLHYPASDIPKQARALYLKNWLRLIPDTHYTPVDIVPTLTPATEAPLDLSYASLRSVSPIHIEYLHNMGVAASMSISISKDGDLWGLIACHHQTPRFLTHELRNACEFFGQAVSLQLFAKEHTEGYAYQVRLKETGAQLVQRMTEVVPWYDALLTGSPTMLDLVESSGAALCLNGQIMTLGQTPAEADIRALIEWLQVQPSDVYSTRSLASDCPPLADCKATASGVLAAPIAHELGSYLLWFRPEVIQTVNWSGEPTKAVTVSEDGLRIGPRTSFELWQQTVALHSLPWKKVEISAATELRNALRGIVMRHAAELAQLNAQLERSNIELDEFALIVAHDLKEPLRGLHNYTHFLIEDYLDRLGADGRDKLQSMTKLTQRMDSLIDSLLHYSQMGRVELAIEETDIDGLLREVLILLETNLQQQQVSVRVPRPLPTIYCDRVRISEVLYNLISNAIKYNNKLDKWIEVGYRGPNEQHDDALRQQQIYTFYVRDNGIGIRENHFATIFMLFKRLHARDQYSGGSGAGLTIAKKIVERNGGTMWIESAVGVGTTFFFTVRDSV